MRKKYYLYTLSIIMILSITFSGFMNLHTTSDDNFQPINFQREQNIVLTFIDYDPAYFDFQEFYSYLPGSISKDLQIDLGGGLSVVKTLTYQINYDIIFANDSYSQLINTYVDSIAIANATTSYLNTNNLELQREDGMQRDIFDTIEGTAIPAEQLETYLAENPVTSTLPNENRYYLYALNLSRYDTTTREHWFNVTQVDSDSGNPRESWLLNWDFPLNYGVKFPYQAYSSHENLIFFDPTAYSWYLQWVSIWKSLNPPPLGYTQDLDHLLQGTSFDIQQLIVSQVMGEWVSELIQGGLNISPSQTMQIPSSIQVDLRVFNGLNSFNLTENELVWAINKDFIIQQLSILYPLANTINLNITFTNLQDDPTISHLLNTTEYFFAERKTATSTLGPSHSSIASPPHETEQFPPPPNPPKPIPIESYRYFEADKLQDALLQLDSQYFSSSLANITVHGVFFLMDNASLTVVKPDRSYKLLTTYSTPQHFIGLMELDRLYYSDHQTPKYGLTHALLKAILHSINLPLISETGTPTPPFVDQLSLHAGGSTGSQQNYMASFINTLMSEYAYEYSFAKTQYDALLRLTADQWYEQAAYNFTLLLGKYNNGSTELASRLRLASTLANTYQTAYKNHDYITALLTANYLIQTLLTGGYVPTTTGIIPPSSTGPLPTTTVVTTTEEPDRSRTVMEIPTETTDSNFSFMAFAFAFFALVTILRYKFKPPKTS